MKKISIVLGFLFLSLTVVADDHAPNILGLETYACNFNKEMTCRMFLPQPKSGIILRVRIFHALPGICAYSFLSKRTRPATRLLLAWLITSFEAQGTVQDEMK